MRRGTETGVRGGTGMGGERNGRGVRGETEGERTGKTDQLLLNVVCIQQQ